ncbi:MAG: insulinase family protein [Thermoguttaceae bacterium]|nr:insulinase family protein [Thermoguttaceae bacterium]
MDANNRIHRFDNGLVLLFEEMAWSESFAISIAVKAGSYLDPDELTGLASLTCEMTDRGAGEYDNRSFLEAFENLGVHSSTNVKKTLAAFNAVGLIDNWERTLELLALQIRQPRFDDAEFVPCQQIQIQELASDEDDPDVKTGRAFQEILFPYPFGRPANGTVESIRNATIDDVRRFHREAYRPNDMIVAVAGRVDWGRLKDAVERLFGDWSQKQIVEPAPREGDRSFVHIPSGNAQTTIRLGYKDLCCDDPNFIKSLGGVKVLSGGMSSRLFTEVREKRGLCYSVGASHYSVDRFGFVACSCGTTSESAQQSLDVIVAEIDRLGREPIDQNELDRVKIRLKSSFVMQRESTGSRTAALVSDWIDFGRIPSLEEKLAEIDSLTSEQIEEYYAETASRRKFRLATLGAEPLSLAGERMY